MDKKGGLSTLMGQELGQLVYAVENSCGGIQVREDDSFRWIHFGTGSVQTAMDIQNPNYMILEYMRRMLAFLPFRQNKMGRVLILGLGGGAMVRFIHDRWPESRIDAIDIDQDMIEIATEYFGIPSSKNVKIRNADALVYVEQSIDYKVDTLFVDLFIGDEPPADIYSESFVQSCYDALDPSGVMLFNILAVKADKFTGFVTLLRKVFDRQTLCLTVPFHDNILIMAFKNPVHIPINSSLARNGRDMQDKLLLPFDEYINDILYSNRNNHMLAGIGALVNES